MEKNKCKALITLFMAVFVFTSDSDAAPLQWSGWCQFSGATLSGSDPMSLVNECVAACDVKVEGTGFNCVLADVSSRSGLSSLGDSVTKIMLGSTKYVHPDGENAPIQTLNFFATQFCNAGSTYTYDACLGGPKKGPPKNCGGTNPIDILNGNKYQVEMDSKDNDPDSSLDIKRIYQWVAEDQPPSGTWSFYDVSSISLADTLQDYSLTGDGSRCGFVPDQHLVFTLNQSDHQAITFVGTLPMCDSPPAELVMTPILATQKGMQLRATLDTSGNPTGNYVLNYPGGQIDTFVQFGAESKIISRLFLDGKSKLFFYDLDINLGGDGDDQTLDQIVDNKGRKISYVHNNKNQVVEAIDVNGESYRYFYDNEGRLVYTSYPDNTPSLAGSNPFGEDNPYRTYHYENPSFVTALTGVSNELGSRVSTWTYDYAGRANLSMHASNTDRVNVDYTQAARNNPDPRVKVTNVKGKSTTYHFNFFDGGSRVTQVEGHASANCLAANKNYTYNSLGLFETKTDWKNNVTRYQYNSRNLETQRTEAEGTPEEKIITTEWHPTLNLPTKITEPKRETTIQYDARGREISRVVN